MKRDKVYEGGKHFFNKSNRQLRRERERKLDTKDKRSEYVKRTLAEYLSQAWDEERDVPELTQVLVMCPSTVDGWCINRGETYKFLGFVKREVGYSMYTFSQPEIIIETFKGPRIFAKNFFIPNTPSEDTIVLFEMKLETRMI